MSAPEFTLRASREADMSFVRNSWLKSQRNISPWRDCPNPIYFKQYNERIDAILRESRILVAADPEDDSVVWAYVVFGSTRLGGDTIPVIYFAYVKNAFRNFGIAESMLRAVLGDEPVDISFVATWTPKFQESRLARQFKLVANPFLLFS